VRRDEKFVGCALVEFFGGPSRASASDGEDPPDLYITVGASRVGVEVTQLSQFTFEPDGTLGNRTTQDFFGLRLLDELNTKVGPSLPDDTSLLIGLWVHVSNATRFRKGVTEWVTKVASAPEKGLEQEREIEGSKTSISVIPERPSGKKIVGFVVNTNSSANIGLNARLVLEDRIRTKSEICSPLPKPIWLAVLNDYWLADADTYAVAVRQLKLGHCFERIFLVSDKGEVNEIAVEA
jgi:hypothetical protein